MAQLPDLLNEKRWEVLSSEYLIRERWLTARRDCVRLPDGHIQPAWYVLEYPTFVNVVARTVEGRYVFVRQYRHGIGLTLTELVAGAMEQTDASTEEVARRELLEETGFGGGTIQHLSTISCNVSTTTNLTYCYFIDGVERVGTQHLDADEDIDVVLLTREEVLDLLLRDEIKQSTNAAALWKHFFLTSHTAS